MSDPVDLARQTARGLEQGLDGGRLEQRQLGTGETQAVGEIGVEFVAVEAAEMVADDEALVERFVDRHGEAAAQFGEADQQQTQAVVGVHRVVGQEPQVVEYVVAQELRLVDDQDGQQFGLLNEAGDLGADGAVGGGAGALGGQASVISPSRLNRRWTAAGGGCRGVDRNRGRFGSPVALTMWSARL